MFVIRAQSVNVEARVERETRVAEESKNFPTARVTKPPVLRVIILPNISRSQGKRGVSEYNELRLEVHMKLC